ncbi:MAG: hypothetical protein U5J64_01300 [Halobacteriales archaeon]|nr:hypothetical protein [Halobacteriales archaeon]
MKLGTDTRAVSEVIGYIIIIGIIFVVFSLVFVNATTFFSSTGENERIENAERGFVLLQSNTDEVVYGEAPRRTTDVQIGGGSVSVGGERSRIVLNVSGTEVRNRSLSPVRYSLNSEGLSYDNGAVFRQSLSGTAMVSEPGWMIRDDMVAVSGVRTLGGGSVGGGGVASVQAESVGDAFVETVPASEVRDVNVTVFSENAVAWNRYMEDLNESDTVTDVVYTPDENSVKMEMSIDSNQNFIYLDRPIRVRLR